MICTTCYDSPLGKLTLAGKNNKLIGLWIEGQKHFFGNFKDKTEENNDLTIEIDNLIKELEKENYNIVSNDIEWGLYENADRNTKIAAFTPIKYGMCWYE